MSTLFTKILQGEIPCYKVYEDEKHFAFLTIEPSSRGHTLLVPKREVDKWTDLTKQEVQDIFTVAQTLSKTLEKKCEVKRVCLIIAGFLVPHVHIHLIPSNSEEDIKLENGKLASKEELSNVLSIITSP